MYQVLYRKYRPQVFTDVVGQAHITNTLMNELATNRLSHAYLFTGTRGTGKTTCAKILAKAVNCMHPVGGNPCNTCEVCLGIDNDTVFDVLEIDAASNNGVGNIRELREEVNYTPSVGNYRVYIIDEVHMLSTSAFNALLKTLEEPPAHVLFILATTEIQKLPATVLSRCQRFDFKRISSEDIAQRLLYVAKEEGFTLTKDGALLIARIADGAMRDALSILDQCAGRDIHMDAALVGEVCGVANNDYLYQLSTYISDKNTSAALEMIDELYNSSCDMERLCTEMIRHFRNLLVAKTVKNSRDLIITTEEEYQLLIIKANAFSNEDVIFALDLFQCTLESIKRGVNRRTEMEMTFIKLCDPALNGQVDALLARIAALEMAVKRGHINQQKPSTSTIVAPQVTPIKVEAAQDTYDIPNDTNDRNDTIEEPAVADMPPVQAGLEEETQTTPFTQWKQVLECIYDLDKPLYGILTQSSAFQRGDFILIDSTNPTLRDFIKIATHNKAVKQAITQVTGQDFRLGLFRRTEGQAQEQQDPLDQLAELAKKNGIDVHTK